MGRLVTEVTVVFKSGPLGTGSRWGFVDEAGYLQSANIHLKRRKNEVNGSVICTDVFYLISYVVCKYF